MKEKEKILDNNSISKEALLEEKEIKNPSSLNLSQIFFQESRNFISKESFFLNKNKSQSDNSNDDTSYLTNKTSSHNRNFSNKNNPLIS